MNKLMDYLKMKSTWTGGSTLLLLAGVFGAPDIQIQAVCGVAIAVINFYDVIRNEGKK